LVAKASPAILLHFTFFFFGLWERPRKWRNCTIVSLLSWKAKYDRQLVCFVNGIAVDLYGLQAIEPGRLKQLQQSVSTASSYRFRVECLTWSFAVCG
jgi:hypothetical protein